VAYVFLNTEIGSEIDALNTLKAIEGVQEVFSLMGIYDVIARIKAYTINMFTHIIDEIIHISEVHSKLTVVCCADNESKPIRTPLIMTA
jgi:hypothetical protein